MSKEIILRDKDVARFCSKYAPDLHSECVIYTGMKDEKGYGVFGIWIEGKKINYKAHRYAYAVAHGSVPDDLDVLHTCDVRGCISPCHLYAGTHQQNMADREERRSYRMPSGEGHPKAKLKTADVMAIKNAPKGYGLRKSLADKYGVSTVTINNIQAGRSWKCLEDAAQ